MPLPPVKLDFLRALTDDSGVVSTRKIWNSMEKKRIYD